VILFQDEASLSNTATVSYKWGLVGKQPQIPQKQRKRERKTLFGCVEPLSGKVFARKADRGNTVTFFSFLLWVVRQFPGRKVVIVLDNVRYHHAIRIKKVLERYNHRLELVFLPAYSPDLNPMERIWWYMRKKITHNRYVETMDRRIELFEEWLADFKEENDLGKRLTNLTVNI
jgi:transposase